MPDELPPSEYVYDPKDFINEKMRGLMCRSCDLFRMMRQPGDEPGDYYEVMRRLLTAEGWHIDWPVPGIEDRYKHHIPIQGICPECLGKGVSP